MRALGIVFAVGVSTAMGCTAILGDFTIASGPGKGDGGSDVGADSPPPKQLVCAVDTQHPPREVAQIVWNQMGGFNFRVFFSATDTKTARVLYDDNGGNLVTLSFDNNGNPSGTAIKEPGRFLVATQTPMGIIAVVQDNVSRDLFLRTLPNGANAWTPLTAQDQIGKSGEFLNVCVRDVSLLVTEAETLVLLTEATNNGNCQSGTALKIFRTSTGPNNPSAEAQWDITPLGGSAGLGDARMAVDPVNVFALVSPGGNGGPQAGSSPFLFTARRTDLGQQGPPVKLPLLHASDVEDVGAMVNSQEMGKAQIMMIAGDLNAGTGEIGMFVGKQPLKSLSSFTPQQDLPKTVVPSVSQLPVNNGEVRWHQSPGRQDLLAISTLLPNPTPSPGINFWWFDDKGNVLAKQAGPKDALLQQEPNIQALSADFLNPSSILAVIGVAYEVPTQTKDTYSLKVGTIICGSGN